MFPIIQIRLKPAQHDTSDAIMLEANGIAAALDSENFGESRQSSVESLEVWL